MIYGKVDKGDSAQFKDEILNPQGCTAQLHHGRPHGPGPLCDFRISNYC